MSSSPVVLVDSVPVYVVDRGFVASPELATTVMDLDMFTMSRFSPLNPPRSPVSMECRPGGRRVADVL